MTLASSGAELEFKVPCQIRSTTTLTIPDQSIRTPQTIAIGPSPAATLPVMRTTPASTSAVVMIQKNLAYLMGASLSSPSRGLS